MITLVKELVVYPAKQEGYQPAKYWETKIYIFAIRIFYSKKRNW